MPREIASVFRQIEFHILAAAGIAYFLLAKAGLAIALIHPSISAVWPATGLAIAAVLLCGPGVGAAIFAASFLANATTSGDVAPSLMIAAGNTLEPLVAGHLINRWSNGQQTFDTPGGIATFALVAALAATPISATLGVGALWLSGNVQTESASLMWLTWWLANLAGAVVVTPALVLWSRDPATRGDLPMLLALLIITCIVGLFSFDPNFAVASSRSGRFAFLALIPLLWTALGRNPRDTATVAVILSCFAVLGTLSAGPSDRATLDDALLYTLAFVVSASLPSLALSAEVSMRRQAEQRLRSAYDRLEIAVEQRTAELVKSNAALRDVIDQSKALEQANEEQRIQLVEAQRLANLGSWTWDVKSGAVTWSPQLFEIYGIRPDQFGDSFEDFLGRIHPDDRDHVAKTIATAARSGVAFKSEERIVRPDGTIRHLDSSGEVVKNAAGEVIEMIGICRDITAERTTNDALRESEESVRRLVNGIRDYAIFMLDPGGKIVSWNAGAARIKGYERDEILGKHVSIFYTPEDQTSGLAALKAAAEHGRYEGEGWRMRRDGTRFWANIVIDAIHDRDGNLIGFGKITRDVTEKRNAQIALEEARDQLAQIQKMETIGQVTGGVAHDFNNLLAALLSSLNLLEKRLPPDPQSRKLLENAISAAERGASLTQRLLTYARRQDLKPEIVDVSTLITGLAELLRRSIGPSIVIETRWSGDSATALVDPTQLELAIFNLAINARDAMPAGGALTLETTRETVTRKVAAGDLEPGVYVRVTVRDTGSGMDEATVKRAIEPFFTTKGIGKGTGLGLSMVQGLAAQSGGAMTIESRVGAGTVVSVWLPATDRPPTGQKARSPDTAPSWVEGCRILVVDDDPLVAMGTVAMLEDLGHAPIEASSGRQALKILETTDGIDLVVTDQAMPGMTGTELIAAIRKQRPHLPVILATGWAELPENQPHAFLKLSKPYSQEQLARSIRRCLAQWNATAASEGG